MKRTLVTMLLLGLMTLVFAQANTLFFSEYIEGSSNNKALEIFNGTGAPVDLTGYTVRLGSNGGEWSATNMATLSGTLANNNVYIIANAGAAPAILSIADLTSTVTYFNGNDAIGLFDGDTLIDIIGVYQTDPGTAWDVAGVVGATLNHTLIRKPNVIQGNTNWTVAAGTTLDNSEWLVEAQDYFSNIGSHTFNPGGADITASPTFTPPAGVYTSGISVTMASTTPGATVRYTMDGTEPTATSTIYSAPIALNATTTIKAKAWATGFEPSYTATANYIFPTLVSNISALRSMPADNSTVYYLPNPVILAFKQSFRNQKYFQDSGAAILVDDTGGVISNNYNIGDAVPGLTGKLNLYFETLQFLPTANPGAATSTGNAISIPTVTIAQLNSDIGINAYQARLVRIDNAHFDAPAGNYTTNPAVNYALTDATGSLTLRTAFFDVNYIDTPMHTGNFNVQGLITHFQSTVQITPRMLTDFNPPVSNEDEVITPAGTALMGNYPNPFNPETTIQYNMEKAAPADMVIYNQKGQVVKSFSVNQANKGINSLVWNGTDNSGKSVSSGVYYFRLKSGSYSSTKKMVLMK